MSDEPKLSKEAFARILTEARADEIADETAAMTKEERDAFLAKAGVTEEDKKASLARQRKKFEEARAKQQKSTAAPAPKPALADVIDLRAARNRFVRWVSFAGFGGVAATAAAFNIYMRAASLELAHIQIPTATTATTAASPNDGGPVEKAKDLRYDALLDYVVGHWAECIKKLDEAAKLDPIGASDPKLEMVHSVAERELKKPSPP